MSNSPSTLNLLGYHASLVGDQVRTEAYRQAIFETVKEGDVVLEVGCGTGILSFFACQARARRVYAIEAANIINVARVLSRANHFEDCIKFYHQPSDRVNLPEKVDLIITETLGNFGLNEGILGSLTDARKRFLKEQGAIIPRSVELFIAPVELTEGYRRQDIWTDGCYGVDLSPVRPYVMNHPWMVRLEPEHLLGEPASLGRIDLAEAETADLKAAVSLTAGREGTFHGLGGWFRAELTGAISLSNGVPNPTPNWGHFFFPLERPLGVKAGDTCEVVIRSGDNGASWFWQVDAADADAPEGRSRYTHSTFWGSPLDRKRLRLTSPEAAPRPNRRGEAGLFVLQSLNGLTSLKDVAANLQQRFPGLWQTESAAMAFVKEMVDLFDTYGCLANPFENSCH
jgi:protein arginine N-methyltransferase 1